MFDAAGVGHDDGVGANDRAGEIESLQGDRIWPRGQRHRDLPGIGGDPSAGERHRRAGEADLADVNPTLAGESHRTGGGGEVSAGVGGDGEADWRNGGIDRVEDIVGPRIDITQMAGKVLARQQASEMAGPRRHIRLVEHGAADIMQVAEVSSLAGGVGGEFLQLGALENAAGGIERKIHVMRKIEHPAIRPRIKNTVMVGVGIERIPRPTGARIGQRSQPLIHINDLIEAGFKVGGNLVEVLCESDDARVVIAILVVL